MTPRAQCWLAASDRCVSKSADGRRAAGAGSVWLQLPGLHFLAFSMSKSSLPLANTYSHKHRHACWLHPARTLLLIGACCAFFSLFINFSAIPGRGFLLAGGRGNGAGQAGWPRVQVAAVLWLLCQVVADGMTTLSFFLLSFTHLTSCFPLFFSHFLKLRLLSV